MAVIIKLSDAHYNNNERHYYELGYNVVMNRVVIITGKCSDDHHVNVVDQFVFHTVTVSIVASRVCMHLVTLS